MIGLLCFVLAVLASPFKSKLRLEAENAVLRHQLMVLGRRLHGRVRLIIVLGEMHLHRVLKSYADYYNCVRTHRSLNKDAPVTRQIQRIGSIKSHAILGGLHHHYARA
jgi:hypothetical protein